MTPEEKKAMIENFEKMKDNAEAKALSKESLNRELTDKERNRLKELVLNKAKIIFTDKKGKIWTEDDLNDLIETLETLKKALERISYY